MEQERVEKRIAHRSARIYIPIAIAAGLSFLLLASLAGSYPLVARLGGTAWVGLLSLIVSMPIVTTRVKRSQRGNPPRHLIR
jgi:hypothetical protein